MKKISYKKILLIIALMFLIFSISTISFAGLEQMNPSTSGIAAGQVKGIANIILGVIQVIAVAVAVIMLVVLAIKYITAAPSEKADVKKSLIIYVIGAILLFAGAGFLNIIEKVGTEINDKTSSSGSSGSGVLRLLNI